MATSDGGAAAAGDGGAAGGDRRPVRVVLPRPEVTPAPAPAVPIGSRAGRYLTSNKHIAGSAGAVIGIVLFLTGVLSGWWWPLAAVALYGAAALAVPDRAQPAPLALPVGPTAAQLAAALDAQVARSRRGIAAPQAWTALTDVQTKLHTVLDNLDRLPVGGDESFVVRRVVEDYLPSLLEDYLNLSASYRAAHGIDDQLVSGLTTIGQRLSAIEDALMRDDAERMRSTLSYLDKSFRPGGTGRLVLDDDAGL